MALALLLALARAQEDPAALVERLGSDSVVERAGVQRRLLALGKAAVPAIEAALRHPDPEVASRARRLLDLIAIRRLLTPSLLEAMPGVEERLLRDGQRAWTEVLLEALEWEGGKRRYPGIGRADLSGLAERAVRGATSPVDRREVCVAARRWALSGAAPALVELLEDPVGDVRYNASEALAAIGARDQVARILPFLRHDAADVRAVAASCLSSLGARASAKEVAALLQDREAHVVHEALWSLRRLGAPEAVPAVRPFLAHDRTTLRRAAAEALAAMDDRGSIPRIRDLLAEDPFLEEEAMEALAALQDAESVPEIRRRLHSRSFAGRMAAVRALDVLEAGDGEAIAGLLEDPEDGVLAEAAAWLAHRGDPRGGERLLRSPLRLDSLNGSRHPELWARLRSARLEGDLEGTLGDLYAQLAGRMGLALDRPEEGPPSVLWARVHLANTGGRLTVSRALGQLSGHLHAIVEPGRLRLVSQEDAIAFWRKWLADRR